MTTVDKALTLLTYFDDRRPEIGLSELARLAGYEKATVHRMLGALARHGFVEQDAHSKLYHLGAGILKLARVREATFPASSIIQPVLERLTAETGETTHAALLVGGKLTTIGSCDSPHSNRVFIEPALILPFHATASGIAFLAFSRDEAAARLLDDIRDNMEIFTPETPTSLDDIQARVADARRHGYAVSDQGFEAGVFGIGVPIFSTAQEPVGTVAAATPTIRASREARKHIGACVVRAAADVTLRMGGTLPESFARLVRPTPADQVRSRLRVA